MNDEPNAEQPNDQQDVPPAEEPVESPRSLTTTFIEGYAAKKLLDVAVPDAYGAAKEGIKDLVAKLKEKAAADPPPPPDDE